MISVVRLPLCLVALLLLSGPASASDRYEDLLDLFDQWRAFERQPLLNSAPDYRPETISRRHGELAQWQQRLRSMQIDDWPIEQQVDWHLMRAEMNGMDFNARVLKPWQRDPAYYTSIWTFRSDTPDHEGPNHHAIIELWQYSFPLDVDAAGRLAAELRTIPPLLVQARGNLTGNARELWLAGITNLRNQSAHLRDLALRTTDAGPDFTAALAAAQQATDEFVLWLQEQGQSKDGPSGIGIENYTWQMQNVHLIPMTWEDEVRLLRRELDRALASLKQEEHHNRHLPPMRAIASQAEWEQRAEESVIRFRDFLRDEQVLPPYPYIEPALRGQMGRFVPLETRNFFWTVAHYEPLALWTHWYHWFDLARMEEHPHPSPVRRGALLYNIWDSRAEGMATGFEEIAMRTGLFDATPRSRELVWIMLAQRAARGLGSLYAHSNQYTLQQARDFHVAWTPRGWMREDLDLLGFEQLLYLRQPGYGTSYITGKALIDRLMGEQGQRQGEAFSLPEFFREFDEVGVIPVSMIRWQMTGQRDEVDFLMRADPLSPTYSNGQELPK